MLILINFLSKSKKNGTKIKSSIPRTRNTRFAKQKYNNQRFAYTGGDCFRFGTDLGKSLPSFISKSTECCHILTSWNSLLGSSRIYRIYRIQLIQLIFSIRCQRLRLGPYLPHAPGVRMMVVKLTPSN